MVRDPVAPCPNAGSAETAEPRRTTRGAR